MPKFKRLDDAVKYIKEIKSSGMKEMGEHLEDIMKEEIQEQVYDAHPDNEHRTGDLIRSVETTKVTDDSVQVTWRDNGGWYSLVRATYGNHMYVIHGLDMGKTWNRPKTNLVEESTDRARKEVADELVKFLRSKGIKAIKK